MSITISLANISGEFTYSCLINKHLSSVPGNAISRVSYFKNSLLQGGGCKPLVHPSSIPQYISSSTLSFNMNSKKLSSHHFIRKTITTNN